MDAAEQVGSTESQAAERGADGTPAPDPPASALPQELVFVDLETTGGNAAYHRITEVGIVRMDCGEVVEEWSSLVNPECRIPSYIASFTGITNEMVAHAPRFADIADLVFEKLRGSSPMQPGKPPRRPGACAAPIFVAHNARFDYAFLRTEFRRLDRHFSAPVLCTVKLSRRLFPEHPRHSLDAVMERHGLACSARHRALGDARVLGDFWRKLREEIPTETLAAAAHRVLGANKLPPYLPAGLADELPEGPGVYRFLGEDGVLLYIGKSRSLRTRVLGHFAAEHSDAKEQKKARLVRRIDWVETAGDLGAQLKEAEWIKSQKPLFNKRLKPRSDAVTLCVDAGGGGVRFLAVDELQPDQLGGCFGLFNSPRDARKALHDIARAHALCLKVLGLDSAGPVAAVAGGLERSAAAAARASGGEPGPGAMLARFPGDTAARASGSEPGQGAMLTESPRDAGIRASGGKGGPGIGAGSCFGYQLGKCKGACVGKEPRSLHTLRVQLALSALKVKTWPFPGRIALREGDAEYHVLDPWTYIGTARSEEELAELAGRPACAGFDVDVYRILARHLAKHPAARWHDLRRGWTPHVADAS